MKEIFYEETSVCQDYKTENRKYHLSKTISIISYICFVGWLVFMLDRLLDSRLYTNGFVYFIISFCLTFILPLGIFITAGIVFWKYKDRYCVDYDYTFTTGTVRISKVLRNSGRKLIIEFDASKIDKLGKFGSETYEQFAKLPDVDLRYLSSNKYASSDKDYYYMFFNYRGDKTLIILECTKQFISHILTCCSRLALEKDF